MRYLKLFILAALLALLFTAAAVTAGAAETDDELFRADSDVCCTLRGDADNDGDVTAADARSILRAALRLDSIDSTRYNAYELDGNLGITAADARKALRISVGLEERPAHVEEQTMILQEATCADMGISAKKCKYCSGLYNFGAIPIQPHTSLGWEVIRAATCTEKGLKEQYCIYCGVRIAREDIPCIPHYYGPVHFVSETPDCTKAQEIYKECEMCGKRITDIRTATPHTYEWVVTVQPTCTAQGKKAHICSVCGKFNGETAVVASLGGHIPSGWITVVNATYTQEGLRRKVCTRCEAVLEEEVIPKRS